MLFSFYFFFPIYLLLPSFFLSLSISFSSPFRIVIFFFFCYFTIAAVLRRFYHCLSRYLCAPIWWWCLHAPTLEVAQDNHIWLKFLFKILWGFAYKYISVQIEKYFKIRHTNTYPGKVSIAFTHSWLYYVLPPSVAAAFLTQPNVKYILESFWISMWKRAYARIQW